MTWGFGVMVAVASGWAQLGCDGDTVMGMEDVEASLVRADGEDVEDGGVRETFDGRGFDAREIGDAADSGDDGEAEADAGDAGDAAPLELGPLPELVGPGEAGQPVYVFLFTHTEDPFNHALSEARYTTTPPILEAIAGDYPDTHPEWTVQFQGSDARTIAERHGEGGIVAELRALAARGRVHFGYHGQHDPTYLNRPQRGLDETSSFEAIAEAFDDWVSCERDLASGDCVAEGEGGIVRVQETFGPIQVYSGLFVGGEGNGPFEDGGGHWAIRRRAPEVAIGFGFSDHAPGGSDFEPLVRELMTILSPSGETSGGVFWVGDTLRINDGDWLDDVHLSSIDDGAEAVRARIEGVDTTRIRIFNGGIASKFIYAKTSPTQYGYAHPESPALPPSQLRTAAEIERNYENMEAGLRYLAGTFMPAHPGSRFIGPDELRAIAAPDDLFEVTADELAVIARWVVAHWGERPPSYVSDGREFYSLRDAIGLLARALAADATPAALELTRFYGPHAIEDAARAVTLTAEEIRALARRIAGIATAPIPSEAAWTPRPAGLMPGVFAVGDKRVTAAQALWALAYTHAVEAASGAAPAEVTAPAVEGLPETYDLYVGLGCVSCEDASWSTKPARLRPLPAE